VDRSILIRAALIQLVSVAALALLLAAVLPESFFEDWGWLAGPVTWLACSAFTARVLRLPTKRVMLAAVLAGIPSALAVLLGVHWLGVGIAIAVFAALCAHAAGNLRDDRHAGEAAG
jgi:hypothetical protein